MLLLSLKIVGAQRLLQAAVISPEHVKGRLLELVARCSGTSRSALKLALNKHRVGFELQEGLLYNYSTLSAPAGCFPCVSL